MIENSWMKLGITLPVALMAASLMAATNYVANIGGSDANDGSSWAQAFKTISNAVARTGDGSITNMVMVSNGTYTLTTYIDIEKAITVQSASTNPADTIIDGNHVTLCFWLGNDNALISGFTIINGYANEGGGVKIRYGGGMTNCVVLSNSAPATTGGGVYIYTRGWVKNCVIANNTAATDGGGVYLRIREGSTSTVQNCTISNNISGAWGGGLYIWGHPSYPNTAIISNCTIFNNYAGGYGGGLIFYEEGLAQNCLIQGNTNGSFGGGVYFLWGGTVRDSRIIDNHSPSGYGGGAGFSHGGMLRNCLIQGNDCSEYGGAFYTSVLGEPGYNGGISSCTIVSNRAKLGGAMNITGVTAVDSINNCIFYQNVATANPFYNDFYLDAASYTNAFAFCSAPYSSVYGPLPPDHGNITNDPVFMNTNAGNYRLQRNSPCINTGTNQGWMAAAKDLDDHSRLDRFSGRVDMGTYEYLPSGIMFSAR